MFSIASRNKKYMTVVLFLVLAVTQTPAQQQDEVLKKFAGAYVTRHDFGWGSMKLEADGHFSTGNGSDDGTQVSTSGTYSLSEGQLHFTEVKMTGKRGSEGREFNLLDPEERKQFHEGGSDKIQREFKMWPVEWSGRMYLLHDEDLKNFAEAINLGIEPRATLASSHYVSPWYGAFYLRTGDEQKRPTGKPQFPGKWLSYLLDKPITATVISIEEVKKLEYNTIFVATTNKGSRDGLKVGMRLVTKDEEPSPWFGTEVIFVGRKESRIRTEMVRSELKVGDKIRSRYVTKALYR